jgi:hypothetical protein
MGEREEQRDGGIEGKGEREFVRGGHRGKNRGK